MTRKLLLVALLVVALLVTPALAATISAHSTTAYVGQAPKEVNIVLDSAPAGLSGYNITVSVSDPALATIAAASKPGWATIGTVGATPASSVQITGADLNDQIQSGAAGILLGTVAVRALDAGTVDLTITANALDDDTGTPIEATTQAGTITLLGGSRPKTTAPIPTLDEAPYLALTGAFGGNNQLNETTEGVDWLGIKDAAERPYTDLIGPFFYVIVFAIPFLMQWLRQGSMAVPAAIGIILGGIMLAKTPAEYHLAAIAFIALSILAVVWGVIKDRT